MVSPSLPLSPSHSLFLSLSLAVYLFLSLCLSLVSGLSRLESCHQRIKFKDTPPIPPSDHSRLLVLAISPERVLEFKVQRYLIHKKTPTPQGHHMALDMVLLCGPRRRLFLISEVPLYPSSSTLVLFLGSKRSNILCLSPFSRCVHLAART